MPNGPVTNDEFIGYMKAHVQNQQTHNESTLKMLHEIRRANEKVHKRVDDTNDEVSKVKSDLRNMGTKITMIQAVIAGAWTCLWHSITGSGEGN